MAAANRARKEKSVERWEVSCTSLKSVGYEKDGKVLEIEFQNGDICQYTGVPEEEYIALLEAGSHKEYFAQHIKDGYASSKLK